MRRQTDAGALEEDHHGDDPSIGIGRAPGTFGELMQGRLPGGDLDFLVTFPIQNWAMAVFEPLPNCVGIDVTPHNKRKSVQLAENILRVYGLPGGGILELSGAIPEGKGLASSSADLVATARAVGDAWGLNFGESTIESLLRSIEPSDGVMYEGIVAFYHRDVLLRERLGCLPPLTIIGHDEGGIVDTVTYNRRSPSFTEGEKIEYASLLGRLKVAIRDGDLPAVGRVATRSAEMNEARRPRRDLAELRRICRNIDGLGLVVAHSGTMLGVLLADDDPELPTKAAWAREACSELVGDVSVYSSLSPENGPILPRRRA